MSNSYFPKLSAMTRRAAGLIALDALRISHANKRKEHPDIDCESMVRTCDCEIGQAFRVIKASLCPPLWPVTSDAALADFAQERTAEVKS